MTQPVSLHPDREYEMIQYRRMTDGSILREFELKRDVFAYLKVISPDGEKMIMPGGSGIMQMWDLTTVPGK